MKNSNVAARVLPMAHFQPAANPADASSKNAGRFVQQQQNRGCPKINAIKAQQAQEQSPQL